MSTELNKLVAIQSELNCPKEKFNKFGNYKYRSAEDILEAVKPLLKKYDCVILLNDAIEVIGSRTYVKAIASLLTGDKQGYTVTAYAREADAIKGMSESQVTGAASSYARKYALNGLLAIDDAVDGDETNKNEAGEKLNTSVPLVKQFKIIEFKKTSKELYKVKLSNMESGATVNYDIIDYSLAYQVYAAYNKGELISILTKDSNLTAIKILKGA